LCLLHIDEVPRPLLRIAEDGITDIAIKVNDLLSRELGELTHGMVFVLVAIIYGEIDRFLVNSSQTQPKGLLQSVKGKITNYLIHLCFFFEKNAINCFLLDLQLSYLQWGGHLYTAAGITSCSYCLRSKESGGR
jgi:hypothetical protein